MRPGVSAESTGVTTIELFFDLVFVFTITQLTRVVTVDPTLSGAARSMLIFGNLWWMYGGYAWLTNAVAPTSARQRLLLLAGMGGFLVAALGIPDAFGSGGVTLGVGYLIVNLVHGWMLLGPLEGSIWRAMGRLGPANLATASLILVAGFTAGAVTWVLWIVAFCLHWATPYLTNPTVVALRSRHFVERHGLIVVIALGESLLAVGVSVEIPDITIVEVGAALAALAVVAAMWWLYFDRTDDAAIDVFEHADGERRSWMALHAYGYAFLPLLGGIILFAAGLRRGSVAPAAPAAAATATLLATGITAYTLGLAAVRARLRLGHLRSLFAVALLAPVTIVIGTQSSPLAQLAPLGALLFGANLYEHRHIDNGPRSRAG